MTWILAGTTLMMLTLLAVAYRHSEEDRARADHPTARLAPSALPVAVNAENVEVPSRARTRPHLRVVGGGER